jgi:glycosyltransferase involved in cell wall biosynthesis
MSVAERLPLSIVIPTYGRSEHLARALGSIVAQDVHPAEIIVVDDGSTPALDLTDVDTGGVPIVVVRHERNRGAAAARNTGLRTARSDWVSFLDSDDHLLPRSLGQRWNLFVKRQAQETDLLTVFACGWEDRDLDGTRLGERVPREASNPREFASGCWFSPGSCIIMNRLAVLETGITQDETLRRFEDLDWFLALSLRGMRLRTLPLVAVAIERQRTQSPERVEAISETIIRKWRAATNDSALISRLRAYLYLECAAANHFAGRRLRAFGFWLRSLAASPRLSLHLSPAWEIPSPGAGGLSADRP